MPVPICPRKDSEQGIKCQTASSSHVRKINSRLGILIILPSQKDAIELKVHEKTAKTAIKQKLSVDLNPLDDAIWGVLEI